tara:strand:+ start:8398 stop:9795 length:1398 start_codon:yes stop_codon:yes gene_type:complete
MVKKLLYLSTIYAGLSALVKGISFIAIILIAKYFSTEQYAIFALLFSIHQGVASFSIAGINESVIGFLKENKSQKSKDELFSNVLVTTIPTTLIVFLSAMITYYFYLKQKNPEIIFLVFLFTIISGTLLSYSIFNSKIFRLKENHFGAIMYLFFPQLLLFIVGSVSIFISNNINYFFISSFFSILSFIVILKIFFKELNLPLTIGRHSKKIIIKSIPYYAIAVLGWLGGYGNNFIINIFLEKYDIAAFTFIYTLSGILLLISNSLNQVWAPRFYNSFSKKNYKSLEQKNSFFYGILNVIISITVAAIIILYPTAIRIFGGNLDAYSNMQFELYLLLTSFIIYTPVWHYRLHYYVRSFGNKLMKINLLSSVVGIVATIFFIKNYGSLGIYIGFMSHNIINLLCMMFFSNREWNIIINWSCFWLSLSIGLTAFLLNQFLNSIYAFLFLIFCIFLTIIFFNQNRYLID